MKHLKPESTTRRAFTLLELLVVLAAVAFLALLAGTALAHSQSSSNRGVCANNLRQLMQAWQMYADDYAGALMANPSTPSASYSSWVRGWMDFSPANPDNFNTAYLTNAQFAAMGLYVKSPALFRCPADLSMVNRAAGPALRVRSYSMNCYVGQGRTAWTVGFQMMTNIAQVPQPDRTFVFVEEHPNSLNDGAFISDLTRAGASALWVDLPAYFHLGGANLGMADGHVEHWQWADARTMPPLTGVPMGNVSVPNDPDVARLHKVTSYRP